MDWRLVAGPAHFLSFLGFHLLPLFLLSSHNVQRSGGKVLRAHNSKYRTLRKGGDGRKINRAEKL